MARHWPLPENSTDKSAFKEATGEVRRSPMTDTELAEVIDVPTTVAHDMIEGVTEHRSTDLGEED